MSDEIPEELSLLDDEKALPAFQRLNLRQQKFILHYLKEGNGAEAYRQSYNPDATDHIAAVCGSSLLTKPDMKIILSAFQDHKDEDLILIRKALTDATRDANRITEGLVTPDHAIRIRGAEALAKLHGLNAAEKREVSGSLTIQLSQNDADI